MWETLDVDKDRQSHARMVTTAEPGTRSLFLLGHYGRRMSVDVRLGLASQYLGGRDRPDDGERRTPAVLDHGT